MKTRKGFTLIELLVVMMIIGVLASMLLVGISAAKKAAVRSKTQAEIHNIMIALTTYNNDRGVYPPSGVDKAPYGKLTNAADGKIIVAEAFPALDFDADRDLVKYPVARHPLVVYLTQRQDIKDSDGNFLRTYEPLYKGKIKEVADSSGGTHIYLVDPYGEPYRYLADGRRPDRALSRVSRNEPVLWSAGEDGKEDPLNDQEDNVPKDGRVDDPRELVDDVGSWN